MNIVCTQAHAAIASHTGVTKPRLLYIFPVVLVGVVVSILTLCARGEGFEPRPCHHASVWDMQTTTSAGSGLENKEVKMGTGSSTQKIAAFTGDSRCGFIGLGSVTKLCEAL